MFLKSCYFNHLICFKTRPYWSFLKIVRNVILLKFKIIKWFCKILFNWIPFLEWHMHTVMLEVTPRLHVNLISSLIIKINMCSNKYVYQSSDLLTIYGIYTTYGCIVFSRRPGYNISEYFPQESLLLRYNGCIVLNHTGNRPA